jgi:microcystin-dependent protein
MSQSMSFTSLSTGGEYAHKLNINELAPHDHAFPDGTTSKDSPFVWNTAPNTGNDHLFKSNQWTSLTGKTGTGYAHNNVQPYITVTFWKRVK